VSPEGTAWVVNERKDTTETCLTNLQIAAPPTSVTGVTEVGSPIEDYSQHTDDELHQANLDNLADFDRLRKKLESHAYFKLLPALNETIERFKRQGYRMGGKSEIAEYLTSIGYNYATVRKWNERFRKGLLKAAGSTKPLPPNPLTPEQHEVAEALKAQGCKKGEAWKLAKTAKGATFQERLKYALASRVLPATASSELSDDASPEHVVGGDNNPQPPIIVEQVPEPESGTIEELRQVDDGDSIVHPTSSMGIDEPGASAKSPESASVLGGAALARMIRPVSIEKSEQVLVSAIELAKAIIEQGLGGEFPAALSLLTSSNIPVPGVVPAPAWKRDTKHVEPDLPKGGDWRKLLNSYNQVMGKNTDAVFIGLDLRTLTQAFANFVQGIADSLCRDSSKKLRVTAEIIECD
jgi:phosphoglycolate phosphatase-like HAD superfamily hydrolase